MAVTLTGAYGKNVTAVFESSGVGITAVGKAAKAQKVAPAGAKAAYKRAPYVEARPEVPLRARLDRRDEEPGRVRPHAPRARARRKTQAAREMRSNTKLVAQLKKRAISVSAAANAVTKGVVSACA